MNPKTTYKNRPVEESQKNAETINHLIDLAKKLGGHAVNYEEFERAVALLDAISQSPWGIEALKNNTQLDFSLKQARLRLTTVDQLEMVPDLTPLIFAGFLGQVPIHGCVML